MENNTLTPRLGHLDDNTVESLRQKLATDNEYRGSYKKMAYKIAHDLLDEFINALNDSNPENSVSNVMAAIRHKAYQLGILEPANLDTEARENVKRTTSEIELPVFNEDDTAITSLSEDDYQWFLLVKTLKALVAFGRLNKAYRDEQLGLIRARFKRMDLQSALAENFDTEKNIIKIHLDELTPVNVLVDIVALAEQIDKTGNPINEIVQNNPSLKDIIILASTSAREHLIRRLVSANSDSIKIGTKFFTLEYIKAVIDQMPDALSEGRIGGKGSGVLLAYAALEKETSEFDDDFARDHHYKSTGELYAVLDETADFKENQSFFIGSGIFREFLKFNRIGDAALLKERYKAGQEITEEIHLGVESKILEGKFPPHLERQLKILFLQSLLNKPIICRSSSEQEDRRGSAFAGKYESVELANSSGDLDADFDKFVQAIKTVYASTFNRNAMEYRSKQGLLYEDEEMGILIQLLNGQKHGDAFYPDFAAVTFSHALQSTGFNPSRGAFRIGAGLGEGIVERGEGTFGGFEKPVILPVPAIQKKLTVIDLKNQRKTEMDARELSEQDSLSPGVIKNGMQYFDRDSHELKNCYPRNRDGVKSGLINMKWIIEGTKIPLYLEYITQKLKYLFGYDVDCEFTLSFDESVKKWMINLVQCRPETIPENLKPCRMPKNVAPDRILMHDEGAVNGTAATDITHIVYIDPKIFRDENNMNLKSAAARFLGKINSVIDNGKQKILVFTPGRYGTMDPHTGIPVRFGEISNFAGAVEIFDAENMPDIQFEPSAGAHFPTDFYDTGMVMGHCCVRPGREVLNMKELGWASHCNEFTEVPEDLGNYVKIISVDQLAREMFTAERDGEYVLHVAQDNTEKIDAKRPSTIYFAKLGEDYPEAVPLKQND